VIARPPAGAANVGEARGDQGVVVVPLDASPGAPAAIAVARTLAAIESATLHVLLLGNDGRSPPDPVADLGIAAESLHGAVINATSAPADEAVVRAAGRWAGVTVVVSRRIGATAADAATTETLARILVTAPGPVVTVPPERGVGPWRVRRILAPHDGTPTTAAAIGPAMDLARRAGAELAILHVAAPGAGRPIEPGTFTTPRYVDQPQHEWPAWVREFIERCCIAGVPSDRPPLRILLAAGDPGEVIVRIATENDVDLIVLGWHGEMAGDRAATLKTVIPGSPCPVYVLRVGD